jgi:hypothetical protein
MSIGGMDLAKRIKSGANLSGGRMAENSHYCRPKAAAVRSISSSSR